MYKDKDYYRRKLNYLYRPASHDLKESTCFFDLFRLDGLCDFCHEKLHLRFLEPLSILFHLQFVNDGFDVTI